VINQKKAILSLAILWLLVQVTMIGLFGIGHGGDTGRYLGAADGFLQGELPRGKSASYVGYDLFVTAFMATPLGETGVVAGQLVLSALAAVYMYKLGTHLYSPRVGYLAALFYIGFIKLHPWNVYILTDSVFISLIIISACYLLTARTKAQYAGATALIVFTSFLRPDGIVVLAAATIYALYRLYTKHHYQLLAALAVIVLFLLPAGWYALGKTAQDEQLIGHYEMGAIIWSYEPLYQKMSESLPTYVKDFTNPLTAIGAFIWEKPLFFAKLSFIKLWYEVFHVRPFHAPLHNFLILITLIPLYILTHLGFRRLRVRDAKIYFVSLLIGKAIIVAFTFADWTGRFLLHVMPVILLIAAGGVEPYLAALLKKIPYGLSQRT
jgi:hypothetical protein